NYRVPPVSGFFWRKEFPKSIITRPWCMIKPPRKNMNLPTILSCRTVLFWVAPIALASLSTPAYAQVQANPNPVALSYAQRQQDRTNSPVTITDASNNPVVVTGGSITGIPVNGPQPSIGAALACNIDPITPFTSSDPTCPFVANFATNGNIVNV